MKRIDKQHLPEQVTYLVLWLVVFLIPVVGDYYSAYNNAAVNFSWRAVGISWLLTLPFLLLFIANNYLLAPYLLLRKKYAAYTVSILAVIVLLFWLYPSLYHPHHGGTFVDRERSVPEYACEREAPAGHPHSYRKSNAHKRLDRKEFGYPDASLPHSPFFSPGPPVVARIVMAILLVGFNIAIKLMFKSVRDEQTLKELENERLQAELEYLKYQINPHFFMNTLNNIHALVDIDAARARKALVDLSKLMRYVLYEASNKIISLSREVQFLSNYIELMKLRYTDKVNIDISFPAEIPPDVLIPPLLFVSFVENAFKHGVSYRNDSYIHVSMELDGDKLIFHCDNSNWQKDDGHHHGIGLDNIRKRLRLLFGNDYTLSIDGNNEHYNVLLVTPLL